MDIAEHSAPAPDAAVISAETLPKYVLISPVRNEAAFIEKTIQSVISQTVLPLRWLIVDNGCTDGTEEIVRQYTDVYSWIELVKLPASAERSFAGKSHAFNTGWRMVDHLDFEIIGNVDCDISFSPGHFEFLLRQFRADPRLGVAGTVYEEVGGFHSGRDSFEGHNLVSGACQIFRRECLQQVGGYKAHPRGGIDWIAVTTARMLGWKTRQFRELSFFHHRIIGTAQRSPLAALRDYGMKDYYLGSHPIWVLCKVGYRLFRTPYVIGAAAFLSGYVWAFVKRIERPVSPELMRFHRAEQLHRLRLITAAVVSGKRLDKFELP